MNNEIPSLTILALTHRHVAGVSVTVGADVHVAQVEDGGDDLNDAVLAALLHTYPGKETHTEG